MIKDDNNILKDLIVNSINILREPAGKKYSKIEDIKNNYSEFLKDFHSGLFFLHTMTIEAIIHAEEMMSAFPSLPKDQAGKHKKGLNQLRQILRSINDSILWITIPEPSFFIGRSCLWVSRGHLKDQNYESIKDAFNIFINNDDVLPIWNDATRCIDIGDITLISPKGIKFVEVKSGKVNNEIFDMMEKNDGDDIESDLDKFYDNYGPKGMAQIDRILKQGDKAGKLNHILTNEDVFDPFVNSERKAISPSNQLRRYDNELTSLLIELRNKDFITHSIDGCLHILAFNRERSMSIDEGGRLIQQHIKDKFISPMTNEIDCSDVILSLDDSLDYPTAMPLMLKPWNSEDIAKVCLGQIEIYYGFDVNAWAKHFKSSKLVWSSSRLGKKESSKPRNKRLFVVNNRIPVIVTSKGQELHLGTKFLQHILCEGIRPTSLAENYDKINSS